MPPDKPANVKPKSAGLTRVLMLLIFLGLWLLIQLSFNSLINRLGLAGLEQVGLRFFQLVAGLATLAPLIGYYFIDYKLAIFFKP